MKVLALIAVAALVTTPALAAKAKQKHHRHHGGYHQVLPGGAGDWRNSGNRYDPYAVYSYDGRPIGRDPDANIRQSLRDEDWFFRFR